VNTLPEGRAILYCEGAFGTPNGKTAHGLIRRSRRYRVLSVVDSSHAGKDAGEMLDGKPCEIPIWGSMARAIREAEAGPGPATHMVIGLAPDGGRLNGDARSAVLYAITEGLHVDSGLHDFLSEDPEIARLASESHVHIRDVRKPPPRSELHFFNGKIEEVGSLRIALLGTDSAVGKRTTAWLLVDALETAGHRAELIGTGQTAWMQGVRHGIILDSLVNDFVAGEIEHAIWDCWKSSAPEVMVLEGQGSLMNPAYPGGMELLAAGRPHAIILQHAPARKHYDGFPNHLMHPLEKQIRAVETLSEKPVLAITINHENLTPSQAREECRRISETTGLPAIDVLLDGASELVKLVGPLIQRKSA
jgi:uncharacterized NAD-dependent epimerase/dehydratase family protein